MTDIDRITNLMGLGEQVMTFLDKLGTPHGYYSVGSYGISVQMESNGVPWRLEVYPLPDTIQHARIAMPMGLLISRDFGKFEHMSKYEHYPEWAAYLAWIEYPSY